MSKRKKYRKGVYIILKDKSNFIDKTGHYRIYGKLATILDIISVHKIVERDQGLLTLSSGYYARVENIESVVTKENNPEYFL